MVSAFKKDLEPTLGSTMAGSNEVPAPQGGSDRQGRRAARLGARGDDEDGAPRRRRAGTGRIEGPLLRCDNRESRSPMQTSLRMFATVLLLAEGGVSS